MVGFAKQRYSSDDCVVYNCYSSLSYGYFIQFYYG
jgi:hypothetical protein